MYFDNKNNNNTNGNDNEDDNEDAKSSKSMYRVNASAVGSSAAAQRAFWSGSRGDLATTASDDEEEGGGGGVNDGRRSTTPTRSMITGSTPQLDTSVVSAHCVRNGYFKYYKYFLKLFLIVKCFG